MALTIVFETHSTTLDNERGIATGWLGGRLSATGRANARMMGLRRRDDGVTAVMTSDLNRAVETAWIAFRGSGIPVSLDWRLRECNYGAMNGMPQSQLRVERPRRLDEPFPNGESWRQAIERVERLLSDVERKHKNGRIFLIGHVATRWALDHYARGASLDRLIDEPFHWQEGWEYVLPRSRTHERAIAGI